MRVVVLAVGKLRDGWAQEGCAEYLKRLGGRLPVEVLELRDGAQILGRVPARHPLWALEERGEELTSRGLAARIERAGAGGALGLALCIGGPDGLPEEVLARAAARVSLSRLTLPHRLVRVLLLEQLYRARTILEGGPYHRD